MAFLSYALVSFGSLFSIVDPLAAVPIFLALVGHQPRVAQASVAARAASTCFVVLTLFGLAGSVIFSFFGITLPALKIAGGILLFGVALDMMRAHRSDTRTTDEEATLAETKEDVGAVPIGMPLLSGPGAIATVIVLVGKAGTLAQRAGLFSAIVAVSLTSYLILRSAGLIARALGKTGINVVGRVMGLVLAAVSVQFVIDGLHGAFPQVRTN